MSDVIFTPVFKGTKYQHHICSECGGKIYMERIFSGLYFPGAEDVRFCPLCGGPVVRFAQTPIYEEEIDFSPLQPFYDLHREMEDRAKYLYWCVLTDDQRSRASKLTEFAVKDGWTEKAAQVVEEAARYAPSYHGKKKLENRFGRESDG